MLVDGKSFSTLWYDNELHQVNIIDQTTLPHHFTIISLKTLDDFCNAIVEMQVRGAPLIGATAAFGLAMALAENPSIDTMKNAAARLMATRPTAVNLRWALQRVQQAIADLPQDQMAQSALEQAQLIRSEDITTCESIGEKGADLLSNLYQKKGEEDSVLNILTHCNAGWLATIDWGTALAPIYKAHQRGIPIHVWVDETRPRNQGASLTAWELKQQGINHTVIADNTGGHLMQHNMVDLCLVGSDRTTANGDVCNKIGTYLKALAAADNHIDFYVALPTSTFDWTITDGINDIVIEQRDAKEVSMIQGLDPQGNLTQVKLIKDSPVANYAFDVTPARLVTGLITEQGVYQANIDSLNTLKHYVKTTDGSNAK